MSLGDTIAPKRATRFWTFGRKGEGCWEWAATRDRRGYGRFNIGRTPRLAHRIAWELTNGPIPDGLHACHHCDNPPCVRPDHLFLGTDKDNMQDASRKGRLGHAGLRGTTNHKARLVPDQVMEIRRRWADGETSRDLGADFGVAEGTVDWIVRGLSWSHLPILPRTDAGKARVRARTTERQRNSSYARRGRGA